MEEKIVNSLKKYEIYGDIYNKKSINKLFNIDVIIEVGHNIFFIKIVSHIGIDIDKFNYTCNNIIKKINNCNIRYHKILFSLKHIKCNKSIFINVVSIQELYNYISSNLGIFLGLILDV